MSDQGNSLVEVHVTLVEKINFACHQSAFAILRELKLENLNGENELSDIKVTLESSPAFLKGKIGPLINWPHRVCYRLKTGM